MLYVSNPSRQPVVFYYRRFFLERDSARTVDPASVTIPAGGQVELGFGWNKEETSRVIEQIIRAGGANAAEAHGRMGAFTGLLYREDHPVDVEEIETAHKSVLAAAEERSAVQATRGALAFDRTANKGRRERLAKVTEIEVHQELAPHQRATGDEVHFKLSVDPDGSSDVRGIPGLR